MNADKARNSSDNRRSSQSRRNYQRSQAYHAKKQESALGDSVSQDGQPPEVSNEKNKSEKRIRKFGKPDGELIYDLPCASSLIPDNLYYEYNHEHSSYMMLIRESYRHLCSQNGVLARQMPFCVYQHFCVELLYARMFYVQQKFGRGFIFDVQSLLKILQVDRAIVPKEIHEYLASYAEFTDPLGNIWRPNLPTSLIPVATTARYTGGHFGPVNAASHNAYEVHPAPLVTAQRIRADQQGLVNWQPLPNTALMHPTENLLGYQSNLTPLEGAARTVVERVEFSTLTLATRVQHSPQVLSICNTALGETYNVKREVGIPISLTTGSQAFNFVETSEGAADQILYDAEVYMYGRAQLSQPEIGKLLLFTPRRQRTEDFPGFCDVQADNTARIGFIETINSFYSMRAPFEPHQYPTDDFITNWRFRLPGGGSRTQLTSNWINNNFTVRRLK